MLEIYEDFIIINKINDNNVVKILLIKVTCLRVKIEYPNTIYIYKYK